MVQSRVCQVDYGECVYKILPKFTRSRFAMQAAFIRRKHDEKMVLTAHCDLDTFPHRHNHINVLFAPIEYTR